LIGGGIVARVVLNYPKVFLTAQKAATPLVQTTARQVLVGARRLVRHGNHQSGSGRRKPGRPLALTLKARVDVGVNVVDALVGSDASYAASEHQGSKPHVIRSKRGKLLKFEWERGNFLRVRRGRSGKRFFYFVSVTHPGNKRPVRYLTTPLYLFGRANGFKVTSGSVNRTRLP
jgi:hypothetical protein